MLPRFAGNSADVDRTENRREVVQLWAGIIFGVAVLAGVFWLWYGWTIVSQNDMAGAKSRVAFGTVTGVTYMPSTKARPQPTTLIMVKWDGYVEQFAARIPPKSGQAVRVRYVVGRSGRAYIQSVDPK
jgi:hypothetical protein